MSTRRQHILDHIKFILSDLVDLKHVELQKTSPVDIETVSFPAAFIYSGREYRLTDNRSVIGYETWQWGITIEVWARDTDLEDLLAKIHYAMFKAERMDEYASTSYRTGVDMLVIDPEQSLVSMLIDYEVIYRHTKGDMTA